MKRRMGLLVVLMSLGIVGACGKQPVSPAATSEPAPEGSATITAPPDDSIQTPDAGATGEAAGAKELVRFEPDLNSAFASTGAESWEPGAYAGLDYDLPLTLDQVVNRFVLNGLTEPQQSFLLENGFVVMHSQEPQFHSIRDGVSDAMGQPYYLSLDAAFHALHLAFDDLLKALEREWLRPKVVELGDAVLDELTGFRTALAGTELEVELEDSLAFMSVAVKLLDPARSVDPSVASAVDAQVAQILAGEGKAASVLFPDFEDDYGAYRPVGHYAGDPELEAYFRAMTWFGRVNFIFKDASSSRIPLLITLALRRAEIAGTSASEAWNDIHEILTFLIGPSDDPGPPELAALMDQIYGSSLSPSELVGAGLWSEFLQVSRTLPSPRINSLFVTSLSEVEDVKGWRFLGQRFTIDGFVLQNLIFDNVQDKPDGDRRFLPTGLDIMAAFGSEPALSILGDLGETAYPGYLDQLVKLQGIVQAQTADQWQARSYDAWLYSFMPVLELKGDAFPGFMQGEAWAVREMNTCLGSWAELKHDTILYSKMPEGAGGGGPPCTSGPPPAYVEANPEAFYRLAYVASVIPDGLIERGVVTPGDYSWCMTESLEGLVFCMEYLGDRFAALGEIAARELAGEEVTPEDYALIQSCLGGEECMAASMARYGEEVLDPLPIVAAVAGGNTGVLEAATGYVDRMYVVVPINGFFYATQGGVYSYYEFVQPREDRLTDEAWREKLDSGQAPGLPAWSSKFVFAGGSMTNVTGFYVGAAYEITDLGGGVALRSGPGMAFSTVGELQANSMVQIIDGPTRQDNLIWWKFEDCFTGESGWLFQDGRYFDYYSQ